MNRSGKILILAVMAAAVLVSCALWGDVLRDAGELKELTAALTESRAAWEATAEAKEALADVKDVATAELTADDIVRHDTVTRIVRAYEKYEKNKQQNF